MSKHTLTPTDYRVSQLMHMSDAEFARAVATLTGKPAPKPKTDFDLSPGESARMGALIHEQETAEFAH